MITKEYLKSILHYDPDTGLFKWLVSNTNRVKIGQVAGSPDSNGYILIGIDGITHKAHRLVWLYMTGEMPEKTIDHINRIESDNRFSNLRQDNQRGNNVNKNLYETNKSGVPGVRWHSKNNSWEVYAKYYGKKHHLGHFKDFFQAVCARKSAEIKYNYHENHGSQSI